MYISMYVYTDGTTSVKHSSSPSFTVVSAILPRGLNSWIAKICHLYYDNVQFDRRPKDRRHAHTENKFKDDKNEKNHTCTHTQAYQERSIAIQIAPAD